MKKLTATVAIASVLALSANPVFSEEETFISFTPRAWFATLDQPFEDAASYESFSLPMYGATLAVTPSFSPNTSYLLTFLTGEGEADGVFFWGEDATLDADRSDVELLIRHVFANTNFSLYGGARYVEYDSKEAGTVLYNPMPGVTDVYRTKSHTDLVAAELGVGATANITQSGRHRFFSNFTFGVAWSDWEWEDNEGGDEWGDDVGEMIDFNAGYQYAVGDHFGLSARYRIFTIKQTTAIADADEQDKYITIHGPELSFTATF